MHGLHSRPVQWGLTRGQGPGRYSSLFCSLLTAPFTATASRRAVVVGITVVAAHVLKMAGLAACLIDLPARIHTYQRQLYEAEEQSRAIGPPHPDVPDRGAIDGPLRPAHERRRARGLEERAAMASVAQDRARAGQAAVSLRADHGAIGDLRRCERCVD